MMGQRAGQAVVMDHDAEAFAQGSAAVAGGHALVQVVDEGEVGVVQGVRLLHDAYAPVEVGREAVAQVVGAGQRAAGEEGLVAHEHALPEAAPGQHLGGGESAHAHEVAFAVDEGGLAVHHVGQGGGGVQAVYHLLQGVVLVEAVAGIEEAHVVARGQCQSLVHGVVQAVVGLADEACHAFLVAADDAEGLVGGGTVDDDVFHVVVGLRDDALQGVFDGGFGVVADGDDAEGGREMAMHSFLYNLAAKI